jgi:hypothetical protein
MSTSTWPNAELTLEQLCMAANREHDPVKRAELIEEIDKRFDEEHKVYSVRRSLRERAA